MGHRQTPQACRGHRRRGNRQVGKARGWRGHTHHISLHRGWSCLACRLQPHCIQDECWSSFRTKVRVLKSLHLPGIAMKAPSIAYASSVLPNQQGLGATDVTTKERRTDRACSGLLMALGVPPCKAGVLCLIRRADLRRRSQNFQYCPFGQQSGRPRKFALP